MAEAHMGSAWVFEQAERSRKELLGLIGIYGSQILSPGIRELLLADNPGPHAGQDDNVVHVDYSKTRGEQ